MEMERELILSPGEIEHRSFEIIREELRERGIQVPPEELPEELLPELLPEPELPEPEPVSAGLLPVLTVENAAY